MVDWTEQRTEADWMEIMMASVLAILKVFLMDKKLEKISAIETALMMVLWKDLVLVASTVDKKAVR
jgi:hypothetical protein